MITIRELDPVRDLPAIQRWWADHGRPVLPPSVLPRGWIASATGVDLAASFLYLVEGKIGVIEWTTTNPKVAVSPDSILAVKSLYAHLESVAWDAGCAVVISFVPPGSWEDRTLVKRGYSPAGAPHAMLIKPFDRKAVAA